VSRATRVAVPEIRVCGRGNAAKKRRKLCDNTDDTPLNKIGTGLGGRECITFGQAIAGGRGATFAFYDVLVLRSTGAIGLSQEEPFGTIRITPGQRFGIAS
jgi:hypothetical protein